MRTVRCSVIPLLAFGFTLVYHRVYARISVRRCSGGERVCGVDTEKVMEEHSAMALKRGDAHLFAHFGTAALRAFHLSCSDDVRSCAFASVLLNAYWECICDIRKSAFVVLFTCRFPRIIRCLRGATITSPVFGALALVVSLLCSCMKISVVRRTHGLGSIWLCVIRVEQWA